MEAILEAVAAEREMLAARLATLDEIERLAGGAQHGAGGGSAVTADAPAKPRPAAKPATRRAAPARSTSGIDGLGPQASAVLAVLRATHDWTKAAEINASVEGSPAAIRQTVKMLVKRGLVEAEGATSTRRYRAVKGPVSEARARTEAGARKNAATTDAKVRGVSERNQIVELVTKNQGDLDDARLAQALNLDRDTIGEHTCVLLDRGRIRLLGSGCYALPVKSAA